MCKSFGAKTGTKSQVFSAFISINPKICFYSIYGLKMDVEKMDVFVICIISRYKSSDILRKEKAR